MIFLFVLGAPLAEVDLTAMDELGNEIRKWILKKSIAQSNDTPAVAGIGENSSSAAVSDGDAKKAKISRAEDDLYEF